MNTFDRIWVSMTWIVTDLHRMATPPNVSAYHICSRPFLPIFVEVIAKQENVLPLLLDYSISCFTAFVNCFANGKLNENREVK